MGIVFPADTSYINNNFPGRSLARNHYKTASNRNRRATHSIVLKPLTLRNIIFLKSLPGFL